MTALPIGILGTGGIAQAQFLVPQLVAYAGGAVHLPIVARPGATQLSVGFTAYGGAAILAPVVGNSLAATRVVYEGATLHGPVLGGVKDLAASLTVYDGVTIRNPSLVPGQDVDASLVAYGGASVLAPTLGGDQAVAASLVDYSGATTFGPTVTGAKVSLIEPWQTFTTETGTVSVGIGLNRVALLTVAVEGSGGERTVGTPTLGGQSLVEVHDQTIGNSHNYMFKLDEAGIQAMVGTAFDLDMQGASGVQITSFGIYDHVDQSSNFSDTDASVNSVGDAPDFDLDVLRLGAVVAHAFSGNASEFAWDVPLSQKTNVTDGTATGSIAIFLNSLTELPTDDEPTDISNQTLTIGADTSAIAANRSGIIAVAFRPVTSINNILATQVFYSGGEVFEPTVAVAAVVVDDEIDELDAWTSFTAESGTYAVSAGTNRLLVMAVAIEGDSAPAPTYGGEALTLAKGTALSNGSDNEIWYLDEEGIAAAANTTWDLETDSIGVGALAVALGSYENVDQDDPTFSDASGFNESGNTTDFTLTTIDGGAAIAQALSGNASVFAWDADLTEQTDQIDGSMAGSVAHLVTTDGTTIDVGATGSSLTPNRSSISAISLRPSSGVAPDDISILNALADTGATDDSSGDEGSFTVSSGTERLLVIAQHATGSGGFITGIQWGNQAMTAVPDGEVVSAGGFPARVKFWYLDEDGIAAAITNSGNNTNDFTVTAGTVSTYRCTAVALENVDQSDPIVDTDTGVRDTVSPEDATVTTSEGGYAFAAVMNDFAGSDEGMSWAAPFTERVDDISGAGANNYGAADTTTDGTSVTSAVTTVDDGQQQCQAVVSIRRTSTAGSGGGEVTPPVDNTPDGDLLDTRLFFDGFAPWTTPGDEI